MSSIRFNATRSWITFVFLPTATANAGLLSMRFLGGATEVTLGPGQSATIEVLFSRGNLDNASNKVTGIDARFDVGGLADAGHGDYVVEHSTSLTVTGIAPGPYPNWNMAASTSVPAPFNGEFFLSAGDPDGLSGPSILPVEPPPAAILATFIIRLDAPSATDVYAVFRAGNSLPALYNGAQAWSSRFGYPTINAGEQFEIGTANPGDADPGWTYHGFETLQPLIIHTVPEPGGLALLVGAGLFAMWHRRASIDETGGKT